MLIHNHFITRSDLRWLAPFKEAVLDQGGHLRLGYWQGNETAKGKEIPVDMRNCVRAFSNKGIMESYILGAYETQDFLSTPKVSATRLEIEELYSGGLFVLDYIFNLEKGLVLEGEVKVRQPQKGWSGVGFYIEEDVIFNEATRGTAIFLQTRGQAEIGLLTQGRIFEVENAVNMGIGSNQKASLRLLLRRSMYELYMDDLLVQCGCTSDQTTGRIGFVFETGKAIFENVRIWEMNFVQ